MKTIQAFRRLAFLGLAPHVVGAFVLKALTAVSAVTAVISLTAVQVRAQPLPELLAMTLQHPRVAQAQASTRAAKAAVELAAAADRLKISGSIGPAFTNSATGSAQTNLLSPGIRATLPVYDHGRVAEDVAGKTALSEAQAARAQLEHESLNQQMLGYYIDGLTHEAAVRVLSRQVGVLEGLVAKLREVARLDKGRQYEVSQLNARLSAVLSTKDARELQLREAREQLRLLLRLPLVRLQALPDLRGQGVLPGSLESFRLLLRERHPSLQVARLEVVAQEKVFLLASKWNKPSWAVESELTSGRNSEGKVRPFNGVVVRLVGSTSLFDGGSGAAAESVQARQLDAARNEVEATALELESRLDQLWAILPLREQRQSVLQSYLDASNKMRDVAFEQFVAGRRPLTDLINFENDYFGAELQLEELKVQIRAIQWQLMASTGQLTALSNREVLRAELMELGIKPW